MRLKFPFCSVVVKMHFELREPDCVLIASITPANKSQAACHGGSCLLQAQTKSCYRNKTISCSTVFLLSHWAKAIVFLIIFTLAAQSFIWIFSLSMTRKISNTTVLVMILAIPCGKIRPSCDVLAENAALQNLAGRICLGWSIPCGERDARALPRVMGDSTDYGH